MSRRERACSLRRVWERGVILDEKCMQGHDLCGLWPDGAVRLGIRHVGPRRGKNSGLESGSPSVEQCVRPFAHGPRARWCV